MSSDVHVIYLSQQLTTYRIVFRSARLRTAVSTMAERQQQWKLRFFLSAPHLRGFRDSWILDRLVEDPLFEERLMHLRAQICAALALHSMLSEVMGNQLPDDLEDSVDLLKLVDTAVSVGIIDDREEGILRELNRRANQAKHDLHFRSRL